MKIMALMLWTGFSIGLSGAMMPGPMLVFCISRVMKGRFIEGVKVVFGHFLVEIVVVALILLGIREISQNAVVMRVFGIMGGILIYLYGGTVIRDAKTATLKVDCEKATEKFGSVAGGVAFSLFNPMFLVWWLSLGAGILINALARGGWLGLVFYFIGHELSDLSWYSFVSFSVDRGRALMTDSIFRIILTLLGLSLVLLGVGFLIPWLAVK